GYYPEAGMLLRQMKEMGWSVPMMGGDAANHADLVKIAGPDAAKGFSFVSPPLPQDMDTPEAKAFLADFKAAYQSVPVSVWAVLAGDAYKAIEAALKAGKTEPEAMAAFLKALKNEPALSGKMGFNAKGDRVGDFYRVYAVDEQGAFILQPKN
ncbi:MAG: ABC transporter substrate-binding protein, partial [Desulfovibrio sp.]|nr:ABC transporter substrate-binding protein [Desulfovibrio sp.]